MKQETKQRICQSVAAFRLPRYTEIPNVGLYLEQAAKYIAEYLAPLGEAALTPSMISNYVKKGLIDSPVKKLYGRDQIAYLFFIAIAKSVLSLDGVWSFCLDDGSNGGSINNDFISSRREIISVPASYNDQKDDPRFREHYGWAYYERHVTVPAFFSGERLVLRFDAVTHNARVFINGALAGEHKGGFLPFEIELDGIVRAGEDFLLQVAVDNRVSHSTLPVGNEEGMAFFGSDNAGVPSVEAAKRWRKKRNLPNFDFFNYAGINRSVRIYTTPHDYISDITVVPSVNGTSGIVDYTVATAGEGEVSVRILSREGAVVAEGSGASGRLEIADARLWNPWPGDPYLYTLDVTFAGDHYSQRFGVRTVEVRGHQFLINGRPFYFKGFGKHEDSAVHGRGFDLTYDVKDMSLIRWLSANSRGDVRPCGRGGRRHHRRDSCGRNRGRRGSGSLQDLRHQTAS